MLIISYFNLILTIFEPINKNINNFENNEQSKLYIALEYIIIIIFIFDLIMDAIHRKYDKTKSFYKKYVGNKKFLMKFIFLSILLTDLFLYIIFHVISFRFGRFVRPCKFSY